jgi:hypothetical protein
MKSVAIAQTSVEQSVEQFLRQSAGKWHSQRRYYTLNSNNNPILEATSKIEVVFLDGDRPELQELAQLHRLTEDQPFSCGSKVTWHSTYTNANRQSLIGETLFGIKGNALYRDRGFSNAQPVVANFEMPSPQLLRLYSAYDGASFEEEIKLIGQAYRTRQTIITKAGREVMIGQYLETRC